jgi:hypothetical protein
MPRAAISRRSGRGRVRRDDGAMGSGKLPGHGQQEFFGGDA